MYIIDRILIALNLKQKYKFKYQGEDVMLARTAIISGAENISVGKKSVIGENNLFYSTKAELIIGDYVMFGPNVTIITGDHRTDIVGEYMRNITEDMKLPKNDKTVIIEDDVWIGANCTILKGVKIGRGSIIHAGNVITKKVPPYTIYVNENLSMSRFTQEQIDEHEDILKEKYGVEYPEYKVKSKSLLTYR